ncbi:PREDICTED: hemocytin-like [Branchiostoma belcheri]|uniref:Hemocytin-like n=1 Tax=Branchiostoma belcheri TaxID=7741 RepID=A0A6P4ZHR0_BRABE|nr:PREDICTED: hemocytin-like [Branchiostoma belcheri]
MTSSTTTATTATTDRHVLTQQPSARTSDTPTKQQGLTAIMAPAETTAIPEPPSWSASSEFDDSRHSADRADINTRETADAAGGWAAATNDKNQWLMRDLSDVSDITGVITKGRNYSPDWPRGIHDQYVTSYIISYGNETSVETFYTDADGKVTVFPANGDRDTAVYNDFSGRITARFIKIHPQTWHGHISMRAKIVTVMPRTHLLGPAADFTGTNPPTWPRKTKVMTGSTTTATTATTDRHVLTQQPSARTSDTPTKQQGLTAIMAPAETTAIPEPPSWSASSEFDSRHSADRADINTRETADAQGGWSAATNNKDQWLMRDLGDVTDITGVITKGRNSGKYDQYVTSYIISYGNENGDETFYTDADGKVTVFPANDDRDTAVNNDFRDFSGRITARFVKIHPQTWHVHISMRAKIVTGGDIVTADRMVIYIDTPGNNVLCSCPAGQSLSEDGTRCEDADTETAFACEWSTLQLSCSDGEKLLIVDANYGRTSATHPCSNFPTKCRTHNYKSLAVVRAACQGNQQCRVTASNYVFGDPCKGVGKYLEVSYSCIRD